MDRKYNLWLEDQSGKKYPPDKESLKRIARGGGGKVYRVEQSANTYRAGPAKPSQPEVTNEMQSKNNQMRKLPQVNIETQRSLHRNITGDKVAN